MARTVVKELLAKFSGDTKGLETATRRANGAISSVEKQTRRTSGVVSTGFASMVRAAAPLVSIYSAIKAANMADEFTKIEGRLQNATRSTEEFNQAFEGLKDIAKTTGADLNASIDVFQRISFVRDEINASTSEMLQFTDTVSKLGIVSGASTGALNAGLTQLGQSLSSQIVRAEEFNSIMENIPAVGQAIADELGVTTGQLRQLVLEGELLSKDVFQAILNQTEETNQKFEKMPETIDRAFSRLKINFGEAVSQINKMTGATQALVAALNATSNTLNRILGRGGNSKFDKLLERGIPNNLFNQDYSSTSASVINNADRSVAAYKKQIRDMLKETAPQQEQTNELAKKYNAILENVSENTEKTKEKTKESTKVQVEGARRVTQALIKQRDEYKNVRTEIADMVFDASKGFDSLRDIFFRFVEDVARNMNRLAFGGNASNDLSGLVAGGISSLFSQGGIISDVAGFSSRNTAQLALASAGGAFGPGFATGGRMRVGGTGGTDSQLVAFRASPNESITVERPGQNLSGGANVSVNIVNNSGARARVQETKTPNGKSIDVLIDEAVAQNINRAGTQTYNALRGRNGFMGRG